MTGEFRMAKGWRIFIYVMAPLIIALFTLGAIAPFFIVPFNWVAFFLIFILSAGMIVVFVYAILDAKNGKFIITEDAVTHKSSFSTRAIKISEIKGYRSNEKFTFIVPKEPGQKKIRVSTYLENYKGILSWLAVNFVELDKYDATQEEQAILENNEFGFTNEAREYRLKEARKVAKYGNIVGGAIIIWMIFYPAPYYLSMIAGIIYPLIVLLIIFFYKGLIRLDQRKSSAYPGVTYAILLPALAIMMRAFSDYDVLDYNNVWLPVSLTSLMLVGLFARATGEFNLTTGKGWMRIVLYTGFMFVYSIGSWIIINCYNDASVPSVFKTQVISKEISSGKTTSYYLTLGPWGPKAEEDRVSIGKDQYSTTVVGDTATIYLRQGFLKTPWFHVVTGSD